MKKRRFRRTRIALLSASIIGAALSFMLGILSVRRTAFVMSQYGETLGVSDGSINMIWITDSKRAWLVQNKGIQKGRPWTWITSPRKFPIEWWPPVESGGTGGRKQLRVSLWLPFLVFLGGGVVLLRTFRRGHPPGCCTRCGYSLAGLGEQTPCPECGQQRNDIGT